MKLLMISFLIFALMLSSCSAVNVSRDGNIFDIETGGIYAGSYIVNDRYKYIGSEIIRNDSVKFNCYIFSDETGDIVSVCEPQKHYALNKVCPMDGFAYSSDEKHAFICRYVQDCRLWRSEFFHVKVKDGQELVILATIYSVAIESLGRHCGQWRDVESTIKDQSLIWNMVDDYAHNAVKMKYLDNRGSIRLR